MEKRDVAALGLALFCIGQFVPPTLAVAGGYLDGIGVPACIGAAGRAAERVIRAVEAADAEVAR